MPGLLVIMIKGDIWDRVCVCGGVRLYLCLCDPDGVQRRVWNEMRCLQIAEDGNEAVKDAFYQVDLCTHKTHTHTEKTNPAQGLLG